MQKPTRLAYICSCMGLQHLRRTGVKVAEKIGADPQLEAWLQEHDTPIPTSFSGAGQKLGGALCC